MLGLTLLAVSMHLVMPENIRTDAARTSTNLNCDSDLQ